MTDADIANCILNSAFGGMCGINLLRSYRRNNGTFILWVAVFFAWLRAAAGPIPS